MVMVVHTTTMVPQICGIMMPKKIWKPLAPSMRAASSVSSGTPRSAAERMTMAKPVWIQIRMTISRTEFQNGTVIHACGGKPSPVTIALSTPICSKSAAAVGVDELPDHRGADEARSPSA